MIFNAEILATFIAKAQELQHDGQSVAELLADMCNEMTKLAKPAGCTFSQTQAEFVRDLMAAEYIDMLIHEAFQEKSKTLPAYAQNMADPTIIASNAAIRERLMLFNLVLGDIIGLKPEIDLKVFTKVEADPQTGLFGLALNTDRLMRYKAQILRAFTEIPVLVQNERAVN